MSHGTRGPSGPVVKNGEGRGKPRDRGQACADHVIEGAARVHEALAGQKALAVMVSSRGQASCSLVGKRVGHAPARRDRWIGADAAPPPATDIPGALTELECDAMGQCIGSHTTTSGSSRRWIVAPGERWPGGSAGVRLPPAGDSTPRSHTGPTAASALTMGRPWPTGGPRSATSSARRTPGPLSTITATPGLTGAA